MARSILSLGMFAARHFNSAIRKRGFILGSPPPIFAAIEISLLNFEKILPRFASIAPLKCFTFAHLLCPAIYLEIECERRRFVGFFLNCPLSTFNLQLTVPQKPPFRNTTPQ